MLYKIGTGSEVLHLLGKIPERVMKRVETCVTILDNAYGKERDYFKDGGYTIIAETEADVLELKKIIDYEVEVGELAEVISKNYLFILYILGTEFQVAVMMPLSVAPRAMLKVLDEEVITYEDR